MTSGAGLEVSAEVEVEIDGSFGTGRHEILEDVGFPFGPSKGWNVLVVWKEID